jgi:F0F1-type ATP synthase assembly protein I
MGDGNGSSGEQSLYRQLMNLAAAGMQLTATIGGAALLGWWLDAQFETTPWLLLVFVLLGSIGGFLGFLRTLRMLSGPGKT